MSSLVVGLASVLFSVSCASGASSDADAPGWIAADDPRADATRAIASQLQAWDVTFDFRTVEEDSLYCENSGLDSSGAFLQAKRDAIYFVWQALLAEHLVRSTPFSPQRLADVLVDYVQENQWARDRQGRCGFEMTFTTLLQPDALHNASFGSDARLTALGDGGYSVCMSPSLIGGVVEAQEACFVLHRQDSPPNRFLRFDSYLADGDLDIRVFPGNFPENGVDTGVISRKGLLSYLSTRWRDWRPVFSRITVGGCEEDYCDAYRARVRFHGRDVTLTVRAYQVTHDWLRSEVDPARLAAFQRMVTEAAGAADVLVFGGHSISDPGWNGFDLGYGAVYYDAGLLALAEQMADKPQLAIMLGCNSAGVASLIATSERKHRLHNLDVLGAVGYTLEPPNAWGAVIEYFLDTLTGVSYGSGLELIERIDATLPQQAFGEPTVAPSYAMMSEETELLSPMFDDSLRGVACNKDAECGAGGLCAPNYSRTGFACQPLCFSDAACGDNHDCRPAFFLVVDTGNLVDHEYGFAAGFCSERN